MRYGRLPLFPCGCDGPDGMRLPLFGGCAQPRENCQCVRMQNPLCPGEYADVELCVDACGNLSVCVHKPSRSCECARRPRTRCCSTAWDR